MQDFLQEYQELYALPDRKPLQYYAIDVDGVTISRAETAQAAQIEAKRLGGSIRFVSLKEADYALEDEKRRAEKWATTIFRPTPARTIRHRK